GIFQELYRNELDPGFIADVRVQQISTALNPKNFTDRKIRGSDLMKQFSAFYLQSITTPKGKKLINKYLNVNNEQQVSN
ncbi:MAG: hypothetical protein Q7T76_09375, partial [Ferruginibacter sp.]|nr:hypothetical protein [Ferruginibacter sp.]